MIYPSSAMAETLQSALQHTLDHSPEMAAQRADLASQGEDITEASVLGRPTVSAVTSLAEHLRYALPSVFHPERNFRTDLAVSVPLYRGGRVKNSVRGAQERYRAGWESLRFSTSELFQEVVNAYSNVLRDEAVVRLARNQVATLETNLRAVQGRFGIGELTKTDVAQSEARLALARGGLNEADATLVRSREEYIRIVGRAPIELAPPELQLDVPQNERTAIAIALAENSAVQAAQHQVAAAEYRVKAARAERRPRLNANGSVGYFNYLDSITSDLPFKPRLSGTAVQVGLSLELPLYQGGAPASRVRRAQLDKASTIERGIAVERGIIGRVRAAHASLRLLEAEANEAQLAVEANERALRGARMEHEIGTRSLLDVLDAQRELLSSQINLLSVDRDKFVASFVLLAAMGKADPAELGLTVRQAEYGPVAPAPRASWSDWADGPGIPKVVGTRTVDMPPHVAE